MRRTLILLAVASAAHSDDIYGTRGDRPIAKDVKVLSEEGKVVYVDKSLKERSFPAAIVGRVEKKHTDVHEFLDRSETAADADAVMALRTWAADKGFKDDVLAGLVERALGLDAQHDAANEAAGNVRHEGAWMTPAERDRRVKEAEDAAMAAKGLVRWGDEWVTPEDKVKLDQGLRKHEGRWMTEEEIKEAQGFVKHDGKWVKRDDLEVVAVVERARKETQLGAAPAFGKADHFRGRGDLGQAELEDLGKSCERLLAEWLRVMPGAQPRDLLGGLYHLYAFKKAPPYQALVRNMFERQKTTEGWSAGRIQEEDLRMKARLRETSFWDIFPAMSAHVQMPDPFEGLKAHVIHFATNVLVWRHGRPRQTTWWLNEGLAYYFEKKITGSIQTQSVGVGGGGYADQGPVSPDKNPWLDASKWESLIQGLLRQNRDPALDRIKSKNLYEQDNRLEAPDLAKAYTVVTMLILDDPKVFAAFMEDVKLGGTSDPLEREVLALVKHYGSYDKVDERWKAFAKNGFRILR